VATVSAAVAAAAAAAAAGGAASNEASASRRRVQCIPRSLSLTEPRRIRRFVPPGFAIFLGAPLMLSDPQPAATNGPEPVPSQLLQPARSQFRHERSVP
jgi:hypothetical protein